MSEKNAGTDRQSILLENMPRELIQRLKQRCAESTPRSTMRATIERLIVDFVNDATAG